jgi:3'-5' exoribonuclease
MSKAKPPVVPLHQLVPKQAADFFALLVEKKQANTREGKPFFTLKFRDAKRTVGAAVWHDSQLFGVCHDDWQIGQYFKIRGFYVEDERYGPKIDIQNIRLVSDEDRDEGFKEADFIECSRFDPAAMFVELRALAEVEIKDEHLKALTLALLDEHSPRLLSLPATANRFFPFPGGWLEHTLSVAKTCIVLAEKYIAHYAELQPPLNRDAVIAGSILHDLGRVAEYQPPAIPGTAPEQTVPGRLFGHLSLGRDLVRKAAMAFPELNPELQLLVEHIVYSHLSLPAWGSPQLPAVPEVLIVHHADDLDAKMEMFVRCLSNDTSEGSWTDTDPVLKKPLWKGRNV